MENPHSISIEELASLLDTSLDRGLTTQQVEMLQEIHGKNVLQDIKPDPWWKIFLRQFNTSMIYLLSFAAAISFFMGEDLDGLAIIIVILINGLIGFLTEFRAEKALEALRSMTSPQSRVIREGEIRLVKSEDLVPGDLILLEPGDIIPADARLSRLHNLMINESPLTGESMPVEKKQGVLKEDTLLPDRNNCIFAGTSVVKGTARAIVFSIAMKTQFGKIGEMLQTIPDQVTPLEQRLARFSQFLIYVTMGIALAVIGLGIFQGRDLVTMVETGIALAVAAVPEGLPFVATMTLAVGVHRMARLNALVRNLSSVETLGSTTVICTDKTGTLTQNEMTIRAVELPYGKDEGLLLKIGVLCNDASISQDGDFTGDPMEVALLRYARDKGFPVKDTRSRNARIQEEPFDSETKRMVTWHEGGVALKGAPERVIREASTILSDSGPQRFSEEEKKTWLEKVTEMASKGMRTLAFAWGEDLDSMAFAGIAGVDDPPRPEVGYSVQKCHDAGMHVVMITGDHLVTAEAIAEEIGIMSEEHNESLSGLQLEHMSEEDLAGEARKVAVIARVAPEDKLKIVRGLQKAGEVVAMTGDGVNDAVALRQADVGVSMGIQGTEVSKEASDIILQDDRFSTIVDAIAEGRRIFDNIRKAVLFLLCCNLSEVLTVFLSILFRLPSILLPLQILWINLATDVIPALSLALDPAEPDLMDRPPKKRDEEVITSRNKFQILFYGVLMAMGVFGVYFWSLWAHSEDISRATEMGFHTLVISQLLFVVNVRKGSIFRKPGQIWSNPWLLIGVLTSMILQVSITYIPVFQEVLDIVPLSIEEWGMILVGALIPTTIAQLRKVLSGD